MKRSTNCLRFIFPKAGTLLFVCCLCWLTSCKKDDEIKGPELSAQQKVLVEELNNLAVPFSNNPLELPDNQLSFLNAFATTRVVGLGEATHGSREFFEAKHRIFKFLVERLNHRAFGFECDFAESLYFDDYVTKGLGNLDQLMRTKMHFWTWQTKEVRALLEWMRTYNQGRSEADKIHFYGFDCQFTDQQPDRLLDYFTRTSSELFGRSNSTLRLLKTVSYNTNLTGGVYPPLRDSLDAMLGYMDKQKSIFIQKSSETEWKIARQLVVTLKQAIHVQFASQTNDTAVNWRDKYMADNTRWVSELMGNGNISVWAHNYHVARITDQTMGSFLKAELGDAYQNLGFAFSTGSFYANLSTSSTGTMTFGVQTIKQAPIESSINLLCFNAQAESFAFSFKYASAGSNWQSYLNGNNSMLSVGSVYWGDPTKHYTFLNLAQAYDWLIYFDQVRASERL